MSDDASGFRGKLRPGFDLVENGKVKKRAPRPIERKIRKKAEKKKADPKPKEESPQEAKTPGAMKTITTRSQAIEELHRIAREAKSADAQFRAVREIVDLQGLRAKEVDSASLTEEERIALLEEVLEVVETSLPFRVLRRAIGKDGRVVGASIIGGPNRKPLG